MDSKKDEDLTFTVDTKNVKKENENKHAEFYLKMIERIKEAQKENKPMMIVTPDGNMACGREHEIAALFCACYMNMNPAVQLTVKMVIGMHKVENPIASMLKKAMKEKLGEYED